MFLVRAGQTVVQLGPCFQKNIVTANTVAQGNLGRNLMGNYALRMHFTRRAARIHNSRKLLTYSTAPIQENILCGENICCVEATTKIAGFVDVTTKEYYKESSMT
jgi:hypothetical protein